MRSSQIQISVLGGQGRPLLSVHYLVFLVLLRQICTAVNIFSILHFRQE